MVQRQDLEDITLTKLRNWSKRCGLPGIQKREYPIKTKLPTEYFVGLRVGPGVCITFNNQPGMMRDWDVQLRDGLKNKTRKPDLTLIYADPKLFEKIENFIKSVIRSRLKNTTELLGVLEETPIFDDEKAQLETS